MGYDSPFPGGIRRCFFSSLGFLVKNSEGFSPWVLSGQTIATSHDLTPNGGLISKIPSFQGANQGW